MSTRSRSIRKMRNAIDRAIEHSLRVKGASDIRTRLAQAETELVRVEAKTKGEMK